MDGIEWAASAMEAARSRLDIATENLANVSTDGFSRHDARGFLTALGARVVAVRSTQRGAIRRTGRPDDWAIVGDGTFRLRDAHGTTVQTRDGSFTRDKDGHLRDGANRILVDADGRAIVVGDSGSLSAQLLGLPNGSTLERNALETSSVDQISEMIDVLTAQRSYEGAEKIVAVIDSTRQKSADEVARLK